MSMVKHKRGTSSTLDVQHEAELKVLANKSDEEIDYSDIPPSSDEQWSNAERGKFYLPLKTQASVRIDADVMEWLKRPGKGYQTRLNAILREAMLRDQNKNNSGRHMAFHHPKLLPQPRKRRPNLILRQLNPDKHHRAMRFFIAPRPVPVGAVEALDALEQQAIRFAVNP